MTHAEKVRQAEAALVEAALAWLNACEHGPGSDISDADYPGPSNDEVEQYENEVSDRFDEIREATKTLRALRALRAETCPECGGTGDAPREVPAGLWRGDCPAGCDGGRKR